VEHQCGLAPADGRGSDSQPLYCITSCARTRLQYFLLRHKYVLAFSGLRRCCGSPVRFMYGVAAGSWEAGDGAGMALFMSLI